MKISKRPLSFLSTKAFHPSTGRNREKVEVAQQREKILAQKEAEREKERRDERAIFDSVGTQDPALKDKLSLSFMYMDPTAKSVTAAAATASGTQDGPRGRLKPEEKFEFLKGAPKKSGQVSGDLTYAYKPFGVELRENVKCVSCGLWGHTSRDKECRNYGQSRADQGKAGPERQLQDPIFVMQNRLGRTGALVIRQIERVRDPTDPNQVFVTELPVQVEPPPQEESDKRRRKRRKRKRRRSSASSSSSSSSTSRLKKQKN